MALKIKLTAKNVLRILYGIIILANIIILFFLYIFIDKNVYKTFVLDKDFLLSQTQQKTEDLNVKKFEAIINKIEQKSEKKSIDNINNLFD